MFRVIMVPLDGTDFSEQALPVAMDLAHRTRAGVHLVRVHVPAPTDEVWVAKNLWANAPDVRSHQLDEEAKLASLASELATTDVAVDWNLLNGPVVDALTAHAEKINADLVVMTTHGRGAIARTVLGNIADPLFRKIRIPTLFVRPQETGMQHGHPVATRHLLVALDGSASAEKILAPAAEFAKAMEARISLVQVIDFAKFYEADPKTMASCYPYVEPMRLLQEKGAEYLERIAEPLRKQGLIVQTRAVIHHDAAAMIVKQAHELGCDLVALESRGESGFARFMLGSVEEAVVRLGKTSVLTHAASTMEPRAANAT